LISIIKLRLLFESESRPGEIGNAEQRSAYEIMAKYLEPIAGAMVRAQARLDDLYFLYEHLTRMHPELIPTDGPAICEQTDELRELTKELARKSSVACEICTFVSRQPSVSADDASEINMIPGRRISRPVMRLRKAGSGRLYEAGCMLLASSADEATSGLCCVAPDFGCQYFAGFFNSGSLIRLDADGRIVDVLFGPGSSRGPLSGPADLVFDSEGRLWISEYNAHRITVFNPQTGERQTIAGSSKETSLRFPVGICPGPAGAMLVADSGNNRIAAIRLPDSIEQFAGRSGTGPLEFRHPLSICADALGASAGFWVADERNHRLQHLDAAGRFMSEIGKCGPLLNCFIMPQRVAQFSDGTLAIVQNHVDQCLKLFSRQGEELNRLLLDYVPAGICIHEGTLLVTESNGRHLHIYRRE
jgi:sugar lactone lactonase YvrE